jgi:CheY-like chemotaxis protein
MPGEEVHILLVEDDAVDVMALKRAIRRCKLANPLSVARDGIEALEILRGGPERAPLRKPYMILLDLNLPRMNGIEFLQSLRADVTLRDTVVFVLTTSKADKDRCTAYQLHVAGYIVKSNCTDSFSRAVMMLEHYLRVVEFP